MNTIPPEIRANIIEQLRATGNKKARLAQYASISQEWQASIEQHTFKKLNIATNALDDFAALYAGKKISRRSALMSLSVTFILPSPPNGPGCCDVERIPDRDADSASFSSAMIYLFAILSDLASRAKDTLPFSLIFHSAYRLSRDQEPPSSARAPCQSNRGQHSREQVAEARANFGQFQLIHTDDAHVLDDVKAFDFRGFKDLGDLKPSSITPIVEQLPSLEAVFLSVQDRYEFGRQRRGEYRNGFAAVIRSLPVANLRDIRLTISHSIMLNETATVHHFVEPDKTQEDAWFNMFEHLSTFPSLITLHLMGGLTVTPSFFRSIVQNDASTSFPSLQELVFEFSPETADGRWFFQRDEEAFEKARDDPEHEEFWEEKEDDEEGDPDPVDDFFVFEDGPLATGLLFRDRFRTLPDEETLLPLLKDAATVIHRLPHLGKFILKLNDNCPQNRGQGLMDYPFVRRIFELWYLKTGVPRSPKGNTIASFPKVQCDTKYLGQNRIYWRTHLWTPWEEAQAAWREVAGSNAKTVNLEESHWKGGVDRNVYAGEF